MDKFLGAARKAISEAGSLFREAAHDAVYDLRDNALRGFGIPKLASSAASLCVAGVAAVGTTAVTVELVSKVYGTRACKTCNGWEGLQCTMCLGAGHVQYSIASLEKTKRGSIESLAAAVLDGKEDIIHHSAGYNAGYPLPVKKCPVCHGTGVMKCTDCDGDAWRATFCFDRVLDAPWNTWNAYQKLHPPLEGIHKTVRDPDIAAFFLFERDELEGGFKYDEDAKQKIISRFNKALQYDMIREEVAQRGPGWEQLQEALFLIDAEQAMRDPVVIQDVPYFKARKKIEADVALLETPPRPADWTENYRARLMSTLNIKKENKAAAESNDVNGLLQTEEEKLVEEVLDAAWANEWRQRKVEELVLEKINPYIEAEEAGRPIRRKSDTRQQPEAQEKSSSVAAKGVKSKESQKSDKAQKAELAKKAKAERLARQAAEREAALAKAKQAVSS